MENTFNPELFLALAPEMQERVIAQNPELIRIFSQVNPEYGALLEQQYIKQLCNKSLTQYESDNVIKNQPNSGSVFKVYSRLDRNGLYTRVSYLIALFQRNLISERDNITLIEIISDSIEGVVVREIPPNHHEEFKQFYPSPPESVDLLSLYNIWNNRLNCVQLNPNYAKHLTLAELDIYRSFYNEFINTDDNIDLSYKDSVIKIYCILIMNKYVFNILDNSRITKLTNIEANINDIKHDITYLFEALQNKILTL